MSSLVFHVIFGDDAKPWISFLKDTIRAHRQTKYEFRSTAVEDLLDPSPSSRRLSVEESEVLLAILSPAHLTFLVNNQRFDYQGLVRVGCGQRGVIFFCGVDQVQLECCEDVRGRFPWYSCWTKAEYSNADALMDIVEKALPFPSLAYELVPSSIRCESVSMVTASFSDVIATKSSDLQMSLYVANGNEEEELKVTWINDKTVRFKAPERMEGKSKVRVLLNGNLIHGTEFLQYESSCELISDMMQLYIHSMNQLFCTILSKSLLSADDLDGLLFGVFNDEEELKGIQPKAFEELFGIFRYSPQFKSQVELPTLLHLASKFELKRFKSWLKNLPDAELAANVRNSARLDSDNVAIFSGGTKQLHSSTSKSCLRQTGQIAPPDCLPQQSNFDEEEDFYLVMDKQPMPCEKSDMNGDDGDDNEDDEDYLVMDKVSAEQQRKMSDKPVLKDTNDDDDDDENEDDEDYLVMNKASEKQWKLCENETVDEDIYDLCTAADDIVEEQEEQEQEVRTNEALSPNAKATTEATNLKNMIEQLPGSLDPGQQRLIQLMNQFKAGELTMDEVNILFQEWKINNPQKQVHASDRCSTLQMQASTLPNYARRRTEHELAPTKGQGYAVPKDTDLPTMQSVVDPSSRNMHRGSVTLERRLPAAPNNKTGNYKANAAQNLYSGNFGTNADMADGDSFAQVSPNMINRSNAAGFAPPLPARKQAPKQPNKCATLPPLPSRPRRN